MNKSVTLKNTFFNYLKKLGKIYPILIISRLLIGKKGREAMIYNYNNVDNKLGFILCILAVYVVGFILVLLVCTITSYISNRFKNWRRSVS